MLPNMLANDPLREYLRYFTNIGKNMLRKILANISILPRICHLAFFHFNTYIVLLVDFEQISKKRFLLKQRKHIFCILQRTYSFYLSKHLHFIFDPFNLGKSSVKSLDLLFSLTYTKYVIVILRSSYFAKWV